MSHYENRFGGLKRIFGEHCLTSLRNAHVCVVGIGGVGTWVVEALARSGVGAFTLVDLDDICITNTNRQLHAYEGQVGRLKVEAMCERVLAINPEATVRCVSEFLTEKNADELLTSDLHFVVDAIDSVKEKSVLVETCLRKGIPFVVSGAAGGKADPTKIGIADLGKTHGDNLLKSMKKSLKKDFGILPDAQGLFQIPCVFSSEPAILPWNVCSGIERPAGGGRIGCEGGFGAVSFVTGAFGLALSSYVVRTLVLPETST